MAGAVCSLEHSLPAAAVLHRRPSTANYRPKTWDYDSICSMQLHGQNKTSKESSLLQLASLKQRVRQQLLLEEKENCELPSRLRMIDQLQSLCVAYHFEEEIRSMLMSMHVHDAHLQLKHDLSSTALLFRMLRSYGIPASTDMLSAFFTDDGNGGSGGASGINLTRDDDGAIDGLVALYEASYLGFPGETMLDTARSFAMDNLQQRLMPPRAREGVLDLQPDRDDGDLPLHWRAPRLQAIWSLKQHRKRNGDEVSRNNIHIDPLIMQLAEMDFDAVQAVHRAELVEATQWWKEETGLQGQEKLASSRDRLVECFFCAACIAPEPRLAGCRGVLTKLGALLVHLDDIYDVCGTLDELAAFTRAIGGTWLEKSEEDDDGDGDAAALLPEYMRAMFSAIRSTSTAAADRALREHGHDVLPLYKKAWRELCEAFMVEAKWQHERSMPSLDEYLGNGWVTSTAPLLLLHAITMLPSSDLVQQQMVDPWLRGGEDDDGGKMVYPRIVELCSRIFRLCNDEVEPEQLGEAAPSFVSCYMAENAASEEEARRAVADAIAETWKEVNRETTGTGSVDNAAGVAMCVNVARVVQCIYRDGDGITSPTDSRKQLVKDLLFTPIRSGHACDVQL